MNIVLCVFLYFLNFSNFLFDLPIFFIFFIIEMAINWMNKKICGLTKLTTDSILTTDNMYSHNRYAYILSLVKNEYIYYHQLKMKKRTTLFYSKFQI